MATNTTHIKLPDNLNNNLEKLCKEMQISKSEYIRQLLRKEFNRLLTLTGEIF